MKVMMITPSLPPMICGVGDYTERLLTELRRNNADLFVASSGENADLWQPHWNFWSVFRIRKAAKKFKPDIIHYQFPANAAVSSMFSLLLPRLLKKTRTVLTLHEFEAHYSGLSRLRTRLIAKAFDTVIVTNQRHHDLLAAKGIPSKIIPIAHPFTDNILAMNPKIKAAGDTVAFFGFVQPHKQVAELAAAVKKLRSVKLIIVGPYSEHDNYHQIVKSKLRPNDVWESGLSLEDIPPVLRQADLVVLPFEQGASPKNSTLLAAMAVGVPALTTEPLVEPLDTQVVAVNKQLLDQDIKHLLSDARQRKELTENALQLIKTSFTWALVSQAHWQLYKHQTATRPSKP